MLYSPDVSDLEGFGSRTNITPLGPFPVEDNFGYAVAIAMIQKLKEKGRYEHYQQFESIWKLRAGFSNVYICSVQGVSALRTSVGDLTKFHLNDCPTNSLWFKCFAKGCLSRMGQVIKQEMAISLGVIHRGFENLRKEVGTWCNGQGRIELRLLI